MEYQFNFKLTDEDEIAFHKFNGYESPWAKKRIRNFRIRWILSLLLLTLAFLYVTDGFQDAYEYAYIYVPVLALYATIYLLLHKQLYIRRMIKSVRKHRKAGTSSFDFTSTTEFYEDKFVDITATKRMEQNYSALDRICVLKDRYIYLYDNMLTFLLPIPQIRAQCDLDEFIKFLASKYNGTIEYYE